MHRTLIAGLLINGLALVGLSGCSTGRTPAQGLEDFGTVGDFSLMERSGRTIRPADLAGKVWIVSFVFTRCTGPCPSVTGTMARLQAEMAGEPEVRLVTFTVDPDHDQPEELKEYAAHFQADPERWLFLTGPQEELYRLIRDSFRLGVQPNQGTARSPGSEVTHSTKLALVDRHGHLRGYFAGEPMTVAGQPQDDLARLRAAIATLLQEKS